MVAAIDRPDLIGERFLIGGPERLAIEEVLAILSPLIGKLIRHEFVEPRAFGAELTETLGLPAGDERDGFIDYFDSRSEEHTSELQSLMRISYAVFCLTKTKYTHTIQQQYKTEKHTTNAHKIMTPDV